jgi:hypothetical protein
MPYTGRGSRTPAPCVVELRCGAREDQDLANSLPPQFDPTDTASAVLGHCAMILETSGLAPSKKVPVNGRWMTLIHDRRTTDRRPSPTRSNHVRICRALEAGNTAAFDSIASVGKRFEVDGGVARPWSEVQLPHLDTRWIDSKGLAPGTSGDPDDAEGEQPD